MHGSDEYGVLRGWTLIEIADAIGCNVKLVSELVDKKVMNGCGAGKCDAYVYVPRSGRKDGSPVVLVPAQDGPIWYSKRMVRDEHLRKIREQNGSCNTGLKVVK